MSHIFAKDIDLNLNQALKWRAENLISHPSAIAADAGRIYLNTVTNVPYMWDGTTWINLSTGSTGHTVTSYRSDFEETNKYVYAGYLLDGIITITRTINHVVENAQSLTNLETDWINRLVLTYI